MYDSRRTQNISTVCESTQYLMDIKQIEYEEPGYDAGRGEITAFEKCEKNALSKLHFKIKEFVILISDCLSHDWQMRKSWEIVTHNRQGT